MRVLQIFPSTQTALSAAMPLMGVLTSLCQCSCGFAHLPHDRRCFALVPKQGRGGNNLRQRVELLD